MRGCNIGAQQAFPPEITTYQVTYENPLSTISNSDLELAGHIAHNNILASLDNIDSVTVASYTNNTLALYWKKEGSTSTNIPAAYLLQQQALHQQQYCCHSQTPHISGTGNVMADDQTTLFVDCSTNTTNNLFVDPQKNLFVAICGLL